MTENIPMLIFSAALAAVLGFAAHRANICTVKAVMEILTTRRAYMLLSFGKTVLWVVLMTLVLSLATSPVAVVHWQLSWFSIFGGVLFGIGATLNGGCAFAMLARLASGKLVQILTLAGFGVGAAGFLLLAPEATAPVTMAPQAGLFQSRELSTVLVVLLSLWAVWELTRLWRGRRKASRIGARIFAGHYSLSTAAILIGVTNAVLYAMHGTWAYTSVLNGGIRQSFGGFGPVGAIYWILFVALFLGMTVSAWQAGAFALEWRPRLSWVQRFLGGLLMGLGVAMVPGGNDVLILNAVPSLSPHATPAYLAMIAGIFFTLLIVRRAGGMIETIDCSGDVCVSREAKDKSY